MCRHVAGSPPRTHDGWKQRHHEDDGVDGKEDPATLLHHPWQPLPSALVVEKKRAGQENEDQNGDAGERAPCRQTNHDERVEQGDGPKQRDPPGHCAELGFRGASRLPWLLQTSTITFEYPAKFTRFINFRHSGQGRYRTLSSFAPLAGASPGWVMPRTPACRSRSAQICSREAVSTQRPTHFGHSRNVVPPRFEVASN